ncbi:MAG: hypothetical protein AAF135_10325 [Bacteroidota bacterium]
MKSKILIGLLFVLGGCLPNNNPVTDISQEDSLHASIEYSPPVQLIEEVYLPEDFTLDSISYTDHEHHIYCLAEIPKTAFPTFNVFIDKRFTEIQKIMYARAEKRQWGIKEAFANDPDNLEEELSKLCSFDFHPQAIYQDATCISIRFWATWLEQSFHGLPEYYTLNFDKETLTEIYFEDYFHLSSAQDSLLLLALINEGLQNPHLSIKEVYPVKFNIEGDSISFNFDAYELEAYAYGMPRAYVSKIKLGHLIHERFQ